MAIKTDESDIHQRPSNKANLTQVIGYKQGGLWATRLVDAMNHQSLDNDSQISKKGEDAARNVDDTKNYVIYEEIGVVTGESRHHGTAADDTCSFVVSHWSLMKSQRLMFE
ncbi:hypothetical protein pdam_00003973 [Pocillopora damicornis]|uniref:Uncharacterized protein n=1 Tax=Pocillopora damicornis TaxID=46731 RepID=A0A3M6TEC6_POCDA|nr:hypothetical protein pdam_00003973 [Pocillopora damicornis]